MIDKNIKISNSPEYNIWLKELKQKFRQAQIKAAIKVNTLLLEFYWELGADIVERQKNATWGSGFLKQLSQDLMVEFPNVKGFSFTNIKYIRQWFLFYDGHNVIKSQQLVDQLEIIKIQQPLDILGNKLNIFQIPWSHNIVIISKCKTVEKALFYVNKTIKNGWSRVILTHQIEGGLFERAGKAVTNFTETKPNSIESKNNIS